MSITEAERLVRIARRRKRTAQPGRRLEAAIRLKLAVTEALCAAAKRKGEG